MYRTTHRLPVVDGHLDLSFRDTTRWQLLRELQEDEASDLRFFGFVTGHEANGPAFLLVEVPPEQEPHAAVAHGHAADNWRMSLLGSLPVGRDRYLAGGFRFQEGWKPYAGDNFAHGAEGGWSILMFANKLGTRQRMVKSQPFAPFPEEVVGVLGYADGVEAGDLCSDDPTRTSGPSALVTTIGECRGGHVDGSFADTAGWRELSDGTRVAASLLGDPTVGPMMILASVRAGATAAPPSLFGAEVVRFVVSGECHIGGRRYEAGSARIQEAGVRCEAETAGPDGLDEVIVLGDRCHVTSMLDAQVGWPSTIGVLLDELNERLVECATS